jgi:hypothetical protein
MPATHLIRATYQRPDGKLWGITYAADEGEQAARFAERLCPKKHNVLVVKTLRPLDLRPQFELEPSPAYK